MMGTRLSDEVDVRLVSVMRRNSMRYNKLLKSQAIRAHLNGDKFADSNVQLDVEKPRGS